MKRIDEIFKWQGFGNGFGDWESWCRLQIYEKDQTIIAIATDCGSAAGTSITNCVEFLVPLVAKSYNLDLYRTIWIEHYPSDSSLGESFSEVLLQREGDQLAEPDWKPRSKQEIEQLIGESLS
ncbi:hypothetical protein [Laspinema palackyanum]|uniref:hypothetical protein n=1 Tax=Laspinema palackyanum TaxID=3231601 RepID=UPI00345D9FA9|nr:hypothetical protein [Laspinema sp. D2c]